MNNPTDIEIIELRGKVNELIARCEALELHISEISKSKTSDFAYVHPKSRAKESYEINLLKAAWFPIMAALIRLTFKVVYRVKK